MSGLVDAAGTHYVDTESRSCGSKFFSTSQASVSSSWQKENIFARRDLRALPKTLALRCDRWLDSDPGPQSLLR
ncbi:hypothetical protein [Rhodococcus pyridinivorans]|uniref:hypothetical protein n=1 Tax=Rhodococcus pyridinivorans TaxID=103816 RepID=UPI000ABD7031|nr:hypothetical protein [Rhodococcus pyridinivorans]